MTAIMAAQQTEIDHKLVLDKISHPLIMTDEVGTITYLNEAAEYLGICTGKTIWEKPFITNDSHTRESFNLELQKTGRISVEMLSSGKAIPFHIGITQMKTTDKSYGYLYTLSNMRENLGRNTNEDFGTTLKEFAQVEFHNLMVEEIEDYAILMLDKKGNIINWNKGAQNIKGYTAKEIIGQNFQIFYQQKDREAGLPQKLLSEAELNGKANIEGWRVRKDGTCFWGNVVITAIHDRTGNVVGFTKVTRDLTERKFAEEQREQQARSIEAKNRQLEEFAYITSHDLQEPIRKIKTFTQLIEKNIDDKTFAQNYLDKIHASSARMGTLIQDILEYARLLQKPSGQQKTNLNDILVGVKEDLELLIAERHVQFIEMNTLPTLPAIPVHMHQLFANLINNAIKFSGENPLIEISSHAITLEKQNEYLMPGKYYCLGFKDNGIGFDQKYADEIFKPFKRLSTNTKGTGIGLAVCQKIVENHGSAINVLSALHQGTLFNIYLPE